MFHGEMHDNIIMRKDKKNDMRKDKKFIFVIPNDEKCRALTHELHFSTLSKFFPLQKVNFPVPKIPLGQIYFLSLLARKTRMRARMKKRAKGRKVHLTTYCFKMHKRIHKGEKLYDCTN